MRRWLGLVALILILGYLLRIGFLTYALYVVLALVGSSKLMASHGLRGVQHRRHCEVKRARIGERVPVRVEVTHGGRWPVPWLLIEDLTPAALPRTGTAVRVAALRPGGGLSLRYSLECTRRGYHQIGPLLLESGDLFGLFRRFEAGERAHYVTVHPRIVPIGEVSVAARRPIGEVRVERRIFEDPTRLRGIREFQPGDKLSRVHWRSSARVGTLQTKVYEPSTMLGALVCLDMYEPAYEGRGVEPRSELAVTAAASLAVYVAGGHQQVGFLSNGRDAADRARYEPIEITAATRWQAEKLAAMKERSERLRPFEVPVGRGELNVGRILDATARVELSDFQPVGAMLLREYPRLPRDAAVLVITPRLDRPLLEAVVAMRHSGFLLTVFTIANCGEPELRAKLLSEGVTCYDLDQPHHLSRLAAVRL